ncbi:hypothetical protein VNO80_17517 [Phaseolus coccineus]|uniref:Uncharacterized protein n=1 Tax=Phaseolus coccineus TaxID=3886 RepID=A0AAN9QVL2_PHACN
MSVEGFVKLRQVGPTCCLLPSPAPIPITPPTRPLFPFLSPLSSCRRRQTPLIYSYLFICLFYYHNHFLIHQQTQFPYL